MQTENVLPCLLILDKLIEDLPIQVEKGHTGVETGHLTNNLNKACFSKSFLSFTTNRKLNLITKNEGSQ